MQRLWSLIVVSFVAAILAVPVDAQGLEKPKLTIGVGGKPLIYYLPLTIAERNGYFKAEGLDVEILDFPGGAKALQALLGGSVDIVSGAYEHTISQQAKGQAIEALVLKGTLFGHRARADEGEGRRVEVAGRSERDEGRRHRTRLVDEHVRQHPAREGRPQARCRRRSSASAPVPVPSRS